MKLPTLAVVACTLGLTAGAVFGTTINTTPYPNGVNVLASIPRHEIYEPSAQQILQMSGSAEHYPLYTPRGRIEVADLSFHGLYRASPIWAGYYPVDWSHEQRPNDQELSAESETQDAELVQLQPTLVEVSQPVLTQPEGDMTRSDQPSRSIVAAPVEVDPGPKSNLVSVGFESL